MYAEYAIQPRPFKNFLFPIKLTNPVCFKPMHKSLCLARIDESVGLRKKAFSRILVVKIFKIELLIKYVS